MSGASYSSDCPNCGNPMNSYTDTKPYDISGHECLYCGFTAYMTTYYMSLEELNDLRIDRDMKPLKKLPKQDKSL